VRRTALICGVSGQDGAYLAKLLLEKGYVVHGASRDAELASFRNLERLGIRSDIRLLSMTAMDFRSVLTALTNVGPDEIYNLGGESSVGLSFDRPLDTFESITVGTINLLEAMRFIGKPTKFYNASSSECFGNTDGQPANEETPFRPRSPYAVAKAAAFWQVANYREAYGLLACSGILFNHESPLRPERFVTQKIVAAARRIANGSKETLRLGDISVQRDWGWAPEYVDAMWRMIQAPTPQDFVIGTGKTHSLEVFLDTVFATLGLDWHQHVITDPSLKRPTEISVSRADPSRVLDRLQWSCRTGMDDIARKMVFDELF
jgi:GDPmannose 4,6-dehydratase